MCSIARPGPGTDQYTQPRLARRVDPLAFFTSPHPKRALSFLDPFAYRCIDIWREGENEKARSETEGLVMRNCLRVECLELSHGTRCKESLW